MADFGNNLVTSASAESATGSSGRVEVDNNNINLSNLKNPDNNLPLSQKAELDWHPDANPQLSSNSEAINVNNNEIIPPPSSAQIEQKEQLAYNQALSEKIAQEKRDREQAEITAAREEIQIAQKQIHHLADTPAAASIDNAVEIFAADEKKGIFNRGIFSAISFFAAYHRKEAQRKSMQRKENKTHANTPAYTERDQEQQQNSQNLG